MINYDYRLPACPFGELNKSLVTGSCRGRVNSETIVPVRVLHPGVEACKEEGYFKAEKVQHQMMCADSETEGLFSREREQVLKSWRVNSS